MLQLKAVTLLLTAVTTTWLLLGTSARPVYAPHPLVPQGVKDKTWYPHGEWQPLHRNPDSEHPHDALPSSSAALATTGGDFRSTVAINHGDISSAEERYVGNNALQGRAILHTGCPEAHPGQGYGLVRDSYPQGLPAVRKLCMCTIGNGSLHRCCLCWDRCRVCHDYGCQRPRDHAAELMRTVPLRSNAGKMF